jgi:hypothetical protein
MNMAALNGGDLRRLLVSTEFFSDLAIFLGSFQVNTPCSRSRALLSRVTLAVQSPGEEYFDLCPIFICQKMMTQDLA